MLTHLSRRGSCGSARHALAIAVLLLAAGSTACRSGGVRIVPNRVDPEASAAYERARDLWRRGGALALEEARESASRASSIAPDWVAPRRFLDELARTDLVGVEALAQHRAELAIHPDDAGVSYLAGRLEGRSGSWRFERAVVLDPSLAWGWHGLAWAAANNGDVTKALRHGEKALALARDAFEVAYFQGGLARMEFARGHPREALARILPLISSPEIAPVDRLELSVQAAQIELSMFFQAEGRRGEQRALRLLREEELTELEVEALVARLRFLRTSDSWSSLELQLALATRSSPARDRLRAELMLEERPTPLALGLLARASAKPNGRLASGPLLRAARFAAGQFELGVEEWLADLPAAVLDERRLPRENELASLVDAARELGGSAPRPVSISGGESSRAAARSLSSFGDRLIAAGWFREARAVAGALAAHDLDQALALEDRAAAGQQLLAAVRRLLVTSDPVAFAASSLDGDAPQRMRVIGRGPQGEPQKSHIDGVLDALAQLFSSARLVWGPAWAPDVTPADFRASPRYTYGWFGELVHPGPFFSREDEHLGLGTAGEVVPGFARAFAAIGRFALLGEVLGGEGPDATVLQTTLVERRSGTHLGVPWTGTIAWCEGSDVQPRAAREGASISGAALHEGYWVDIDAVRRERDLWARLEREFGGDEQSARRLAALATRGLAIASPANRPDLARLERRSVQALLGEADRMRLAVLAERQAQGGGSTGVTLDELVQLTAIHEEGHLCDRGRLLPIAEHPLRILAFVTRVGLGPQSIAERLEYRAQLTALCEAPDPRLAWVDVLSAGEGEAQGITPHAAAYRRLLIDLVETLDRDFARNPEHYPELDAGHVLAHQLHRLPPESLRRVALQVAESEGLTAD
ncbi:MAG TPA: tetratricopeptide repeat protein [Planctomycetota bacterium]|nr:tetratricopeptide repeat protein [Planctomycetota bacterium]